MKGDNKFLIPRTNLAESIHGSWLAAAGSAKYVEMYSACINDLSNSVLQTARYTSFHKGQYVGRGPNLDTLKRRTESHESKTYSAKAFVDLTNDVANEIGIDGNACINDGDDETIRRRRPQSLQTPILPSDSHRPEFMYSNKRRHSAPMKEPQLQAGVTGKRTEDTEEDLFSAFEYTIHDTDWAIRRAPKGSQVRCQGYLGRNLGKCNKLINERGRLETKGVPAPSVYCRIKTPHGLHPQMVWFCGDNVIHTWKPSNIVEGLAMPAPNTWKIASGTALNMQEVQKLMESKFQLEGLKDSFTMQRDGSYLFQGNKSNNVTDVHRPRTRDGKIVRWRNTISKEMEKKMKKALEEDMEVVGHMVVKEKENVQFTISTIGSAFEQSLYTVTVSSFPSCNCADFSRRIASGTSFLSCKHLYYVYLCFLGLDSTRNMFIHQATISRHELFQAFSKLDKK